MKTHYLVVAVQTADDISRDDTCEALQVLLETAKVPFYDDDFVVAEEEQEIDEIIRESTWGEVQ